MTEIHPEPALMQTLYWITLVAVIVSSASGVLKAGFKQFDLFGVVIIAIATGLGGGSLRDMLLDREVFWIRDQVFFIASLGSAVAVFLSARWVHLSSRLFLIPDAAGLAMFAVVGTNVALGMNAPWFVASFMGVITGVIGGVLRDVLCNEEPVVFQGTLYATVAWVGTLVLILLLHYGIAAEYAAPITGAGIFLMRLAAIRWEISLPVFRFKS